MGSHQYMYVYMYVYSVITIYIVTIMDELLKGMSVYSDENPKTEHFFRSQRGEEETAEKTEGATREIGELKEVPEVKSSFIKQNYDLCQMLGRDQVS